MRPRRFVAATGMLVGIVAGVVPVAGLAHAAKTPGPVYFREVLCYVPPYDPAHRSPISLNPGSCSPASSLTGGNLAISPSSSSAEGFTSRSVPPDVALAGVPSTPPSSDTASSTVLLPPVSGALGATRYLLGPAQLSGPSFASATAGEQHGVWVVHFKMTKRGSSLWDAAADADFHRVVAVDLGGKVYSAPIIQPTQNTFTSFLGAGEIAGNLSRSEARELAQAMASKR